MYQLISKKQKGIKMKKQYNKKVKFSFNDGVIFDGLSNGTKWNGFDNV